MLVSSRPRERSRTKRMFICCQGDLEEPECRQLARLIGDDAYHNFGVSTPVQY
jgi:hypothetical protein